METKVQNSKANLMQVINNTPATQLPAVPEIADRFKQLYSVIHPGAKAEVFYEAEKFHFMKLMQESPALQQCTKLSLYGVFMDVAVNGLSFDPTFKHLYIVPYSHNAGTKDNAKWEKRAQLQISGYGELVLRQKQGQIKYADNPVLVYDGDDFTFGTRNGQLFVEHTSKVPRKSDAIIACYLRIVRTDNSVDFKVITDDDMQRFRKFSKDADKSKAWNEGLGGMWQAKCIKHAFKNYPKVRTGDFSNLASQQVDEEPEVIGTVMNVPDRIDYGGGIDTEEVHDDDAFMQDTSAAPPTVTITQEDDNF